MTFKEIIIKNNVKVVLKLVVPDFMYMEHNITTLDGDDKWGYISKPVYFAEIYNHGKYMFTLTKGQFADHLNLEIDSELAKLRFKAIYHLRHEFNVSDEYGVMMQQHNLSFL
jgi:hypothetical protein